MELSIKTPEDLSILSKVSSNVLLLVDTHMTSCEKIERCDNKLKWSNRVVIYLSFSKNKVIVVVVIFFVVCFFLSYSEVSSTKLFKVKFQLIFVQASWVHKGF